MIKAAVLTVSTTKTLKEDTSGEAIVEILTDKNFKIASRDLVTDSKNKIKNKLSKLSSRRDMDIVITTGGTGLGPRDLTPEATGEVIERDTPGISELIRLEGVKFTKRAALSRGISGIKNGTLIINLPGSPKGVRQSLEAILELLPHAVHIMKGGGH